jgi:hypothetical protein
MRSGAGAYGSRGDLLPRWMAKVVARDGRPAWAGRDGFRLLDLAEHGQYEQASAGRFPRQTHGPVDWEWVDPALVLHQQDEDSADLTALRRFVPDSAGLVFMWVSPVIPSVWAEPGLVGGAVKSMPGFWMFSPANHVLVESYFGLVTVARVIQA